MYEYRATVVRWIDGDTCEVSLDLGFDVSLRQTLRLLRVNTPELRGATYEQGFAAKRFVEQCCPAGSTIIVRTQKDRQEKYGRYLAEVVYGPANRNLNDELLTKGLAVPA